MEYYDVQEANNILTITFHQNLPDSDQAVKLGINTYLMDLYSKSKCSIIVCDLTKSNYEHGAYISCFWLYGLSHDKKVYVIAKESQIANLKSLMKINIEVPIYTDIADVPEMFCAK